MRMKPSLEDRISVSGRCSIELLDELQTRVVDSTAQSLKEEKKKNLNKNAQEKEKKQ